MNSQRRAMIEISEELLVDVLHMPVDTKIIFAHVAEKYDYRTIQFVVVHEDLPKVEDDCFARFITPVLLAEEHCERCKNVTKITWDWNIKDADT